MTLVTVNLLLERRIILKKLSQIPEESNSPEAISLAGRLADINEVLEGEPLKLRRTETGKKKGRYLYEVIHNGQILCHRNTDRDYVACFVAKGDSHFAAPFYFGRLDLIGKGDSKGFAERTEYFGTAIDYTQIS